MRPSPQCDRAILTSPRGYGEGQYMFFSFGVLAPRCQGAHCLTTTITSQPECHFSLPTEVILVGPTLHLPFCLLITCCQDEEKIRTIVIRLFGELLSETEYHIRLMHLQSPLGMKNRYGNTTTKWPQWTTTSARSSGEIWQIPSSFLYVWTLTTTCGY